MLMLRYFIVLLVLAQFLACQQKTGKGSITPTLQEDPEYSFLSTASLRTKAEQGNAIAQLNPGTRYDDGWDAPMDAAEAVKWWQKAADQGLPSAQYYLGDYYFAGVGIPKDDSKAAKWWRKAAEQGVAEAQSNLGSCYYKGSGVPQDFGEAYTWLSLAATYGGVMTAANLRDQSAKNLTPQSIKKAQTRARKISEEIRGKLDKH